MTYRLIFCVAILSATYCIAYTPLEQLFITCDQQLAQGDAQAVIETLYAKSAEHEAIARRKIFSSHVWKGYDVGFISGVLEIESLLELNRDQDACNAGIACRVYMPEKSPPENDRKWYVRYCAAMAECFAYVGRYYDAAGYCSHAIEQAGSSTILLKRIYRARATLETTLCRYSAALDAYRRAGIDQHQQSKNTTVDYCRLLFNSGRIEEGVHVLIDGMNTFGIAEVPANAVTKLMFARQAQGSDAYAEDPFIKLACHYWHHFQALDILDYYTCLGDMLSRIQLEPGNEDRATFLLYYRSLIKNAYPELLVDFESDLEILRKRLQKQRRSKKNKTESTEPQPAQQVLMKSSANKPEPGIPEIHTTTAASIKCEQILSSALLLHGSRLLGSRPEKALIWLQIYTANAEVISNMWFDGLPGPLFIESQVARLLYSNDNDQSIERYRRLIQNNELYYNPYYAAYSVAGYAELCAEKGWYDDAEHYWSFALDLSTNYLPKRLDIIKGSLLSQPTREIRDACCRELLGMIEQCGSRCVPEHYYSLAAWYAGKKEYESACDMLIRCVTDLPVCIIMNELPTNIKVLLRMRGLMNSRQLKTVNDILRGYVLRIPPAGYAAAARAKVIKLIKELFDKPGWQLAELEEKGGYSLNDIASYKERSPTQLGWMSIEAQKSNTNSVYTWHGWIQAARGIRWPDDGIDNLNDQTLPALSATSLYQDRLVQILIENWEKIGTNDMKKIVDIFSTNGGKWRLSNQFETLVETLLQNGHTGAALELLTDTILFDEAAFRKRWCKEKVEKIRQTLDETGLQKYSQYLTRRKVDKPIDR